MKKILALTLAGVLALGMSMTAFAAESPQASTATSSSAVVAVSEEPAVAAPVVSTASSTSASAPATIDGIPAAVVASAAEQGMTVGEYVNNAIVEVAGISKEDAMPVAQGGHVMINGVPTNITFSVNKPTATEVKTAKEQVAALGGKVVNVIKVKGPGKFNTATVNFYVKGMKTGMNVKVYQLVKGQLVEVTVKEIRDDHVVVDMTQYGTLVFMVQ